MEAKEYMSLQFTIFKSLKKFQFAQMVAKAGSRIIDKTLSGHAENMFSLRI